MARFIKIYISKYPDLKMLLRKYGLTPSLTLIYCTTIMACTVRVRPTIKISNNFYQFTKVCV